MPTLSLKERWFHFTPAWLKNRELRPPEKPFRVLIKRLTKAEIEAFRRQGAEITSKVKVTADELVALFGPVVQGPIGQLEVEVEDGVVEEVASIERLCAIAARECPILEDSLACELVSAVIALNDLSEEAAGN